MLKRQHDNTTLKQLQEQFTGHIRDPKHHSRPKNLPSDRMKIYQQLLYGAIEELFQTAFPVINSLINPQQRGLIIKQFMIEHHAKTPLFHEIPIEFIHVLNKHNPLKSLPFLAELAHYEWLELKIDLSTKSIEDIDYDRCGDLLSGIPTISPVIAIACYQWPVHKIGANFLPSEPLVEPIHLIVYRDIDDTVKFLEINLITAHLLTLLSENHQQSGQQVLLNIAKELEHPQPQIIIQFGQEILEQLFQLHIILGTKEMIQ